MDIGVGGVLRAGGRPQRPLHPGAGPGQAVASPQGTVKAVLDPRPGLCCVTLIGDDDTGPRKRSGHR